ncbi:hydroxymethylbilane synthase [Flavobacteriaceae bacterium PRS1]|nr:hydroxymethylbilane synthase [Flavobacteriaceae bacterium PRS1]
MSKIIRIGTRESQLALWQAKTVQQMLEQLGHKTVLVPEKSTGDLILDKPLYELGITGIFTRTLDIAMLNNDIDIAVHSLKDVPTILPKGIVQAAVLKRGNIRDTLVYKNNEEFLSQRDAVIATGSLRRRAQWLNRYPTHTLVDLRGNVNTRLQKLENNDWNGAIFAAAGLGRIGLRSKNAINLDWMIPAPAQGAIMITVLDEDEDIKAICAELNHEETEICTSIERKFLNLLEGGCTAPIGAIAFIKDEQVSFQGVLLNIDGTKKIEVTRNEKLGEHQDMAAYCANFIIERGGKRLMNELKQVDKKVTVYSTKSLSNSQSDLFHNDINVEGSDFIQINTNRINPFILKSEIKNVIITSKNAVESLITNIPAEELQFKNIYCVGRRTKRLIEQKIGKVTHSEPNAKKLAEYLIEYIEGTEVTYFCSDLHLDDLPNILTKNHITVNEIEAYSTRLASIKIDEKVEGVMFYSPSTIKSYLLENNGDKIAFCIGETTATEASKHFKDVRVAKVPTVESVIELVNLNYV